MAAFLRLKFYLSFMHTLLIFFSPPPTPNLLGGSPQEPASLLKPSNPTSRSHYHLPIRHFLLPSLLYLVFNTLLMITVLFKGMIEWRKGSQQTLIDNSMVDFFSNKGTNSWKILEMYDDTEMLFGTHAPTFSAKTYMWSWARPQHPPVPALLLLDYMTLYHLLESSETVDSYTIPLQRSLMEKRGLLCVWTGRRGPPDPTS